MDRKNEKINNRETIEPRVEKNNGLNWSFQNMQRKTFELQKNGRFGAAEIRVNVFFEFENKDVHWASCLLILNSRFELSLGG